MAQTQVELTLYCRRPRWFCDYLRLAVDLGFDEQMTCQFVASQFEVRIGEDGEWKKISEL